MAPKRKRRSNKKSLPPKASPRSRPRRAVSAAQAPSVRSLRPLLEFIDAVDCPLFELLNPLDAEGALSQILVADAWTDLDASGFTLGADFYLGKLPALHLPGLDQVRVTFNEDGMARGELRCREETVLTLGALELAVEFSSDILIDVATGEGAAISATCAVTVDRDGIHFTTFDHANLPRSRIAGTQAILLFEGIRLASDNDKILSVDSGSVELPMFKDGGRSLVLEGTDLSFGRHGPSGRFVRQAMAPIEFDVFGFACRLDEAAVTLENGQLRDVALKGHLDLSKFSPSGSRWVAVEFSLGTAGLTAALSAEEPFIELRAEGLFALSVTGLRLDATEKNEAGTLWLTGTLTPQIKGVDGQWPAFTFDEVGLTANGKLRLAEGAQVATDRPFTLKWQFASLCVTAFSLERPKEAPEDLVLRISASVELMKGISAGASVDGLEARWKAREKEVDVRFNGIGLTFGVPTAYEASVSLSWDGKDHAFKGSGRLAVPSIDLNFAALFESRKFTPETGEPFNTLFLAAETDLPAGVPIGSTGLSLYAVSGILAYQYQMKVDDPKDPKRFYRTFMQEPQGFASLSKWEPTRGAQALGLGVVIGTGDDGWTFSTRGSLILSFPELSILITASAYLMTKREPLDSGSEGKLAAVLALLPAQKLLRLDFGFEWTERPIFEVSGEGGGEFYLDRPFDWTVWAGLPPGEGSAIHANVLRFGSDWLLSGSYWMKINARRSIRIGAQAAFEQHTGSGSVYAEIQGSAFGNFSFTWAPYQIDGTLNLSARGRISAGGLSISCSISAGMECWLPHPKLLNIPLSACLHWKVFGKKISVCLSYTFRWEDFATLPDIPALPHGMTAVPRDWVPRASTLPEKTVDCGTAVWRLSDRRGVVERQTVQPHSVLALEFGKSVKLDLQGPTPVHLSGVAEPYPDPIGPNTRWSVVWTLTHLALRDDTLGAPVELFGTVQRSPVEREVRGEPITPRPPNTQLWLYSSKRFGSDGSMGGGGVEHSPPADCTPKARTVRRCLSLVGLAHGYGRLSNHWIYRWEEHGPPKQYPDDGIEIGNEDVFEVAVPEAFGEVIFTFVDLATGHPPTGPTLEERTPNIAPTPIRLAHGRRLYTQVCWEELIVADGSGIPQDWQGSSGHEEWSVEPDRLVLHPAHQYTLTVRGSAALLRGSSATLIGAFEREYPLDAARAPDWEGALAKAIEAVYPQEGSRPVYRTYDLVVRFRERYVQPLYRLDGRRLGVRIIDSNGRLLEFSPGKTISPDIAWQPGPFEASPAERWWRRTRALDPCEAQTPPPQECETVLPVPLPALALRPLARYTAQLVAVEDEAEQRSTGPLASWSFTTSAYQTFSELAAAPSAMPSFGLVQKMPAAEQGFDALAKSFDIPIVSSVRSTLLTPVRREGHLTYLLIEAPEPLDDLSGRLTVTVDQSGTRLCPNLDRTRFIAVLDAPIALQDDQRNVTVILDWATARSDSNPEDRRTVGGIAPKESCTWVLPLRGLFA